MMAVTGPEAATCLKAHVKEDLTKLLFGQALFADVAGVKCHIARGGYTGEDGFEVIHRLNVNVVCVGAPHILVSSDLDTSSRHRQDYRPPDQSSVRIPRATHRAGRTG